MLININPEEVRKTVDVFKCLLLHHPPFVILTASSSPSNWIICKPFSSALQFLPPTYLLSMLSFLSRSRMEYRRNSGSRMEYRIWKNLKQRLSFKWIGCCGGGEIFTYSAPPTIDALNPYENERREIQHPYPRRRSETVPFVGRSDDSGMNLAMALAAERSFHVGDVRVGNVKTLMALIEETDGVDLRGRKREEIGSADADGGGDGDGVCCVCMERNKGAAFIPCGHTFCRACSRELWLNRGACPICNRSISEILDIF